MSPKGCHGINFDGKNDRIIFEDLEAGPAQLTGLCCRTSGTRSSVIKVGENFAYSSTNIVIRDSRFIGSNDLLLNGIWGIDANIFYTLSATVKVQNVQASYFHGSFIQEAGYNSIIEYNTVTDTTCYAGDGCVYSYNDLNYIVRRNVFDRVATSDILFPVIGVRRTNSGTSAGGVLAYNNTIIGASAVSGRKTAMGWAPLGSASYLSGNSVFLNNIVMNSANASVGSYAVQMLHCSDTGYSQQVNYNNYWNNDAGRNFGNPITPACSGSFDTASIENNPELSTTYYPPLQNLVCYGGTTTFVAPDGDVSSGWIGARECAGPGGGHGGDCHPFCYE